MPTNRYEKYVGYKSDELKYKKEIVVDNATGNEVEKLVKRTPEEIEEYKRQKELEFDTILETWERLGVDKCALQKNFNEKKFNKIYLNLIENRLKELSNSNQNSSIEKNMVNVVDDVAEKYNLSAAFKYYNADSFYLTQGKIFSGVRKSELEKMFYRNISIENADALAKERFSKATTLKEGLALIQEFQKTHNNRSIFFKFFHPFQNANENRLIREMKTNVMQKFEISNEELERKLQREVDRSLLKTSNLYAVNEFVNTYCHENSGKLFSQRQIDLDNENVNERAEDDFVKSQNELNRILEEQREPIVVDDARENEVERNSQPVERDDSIIIKVPNNNK